MFYCIICNLLNEYFPVRISRRHATEKPWVDDKFRLLIRQRQYAWQHNDMVRYKALRNQAQRMAVKLRSNYYSRRVDSLRRAGPRQWWREIKRLTGQPHQSSLDRLADNIGGRDNKEVLANHINSFFYSVSADLDPLDQRLVPDTIDTFPEDFIILPYQVQCKLDNIDVHKSIGPDNIPNWIFRDFSPWLAEPICAIFNTSLRQGVFPSAWKMANVVPIPKVIPPT